MALFFSSFVGFEEKDFTAFAPFKHSSNRFNLERMRVREKLEFLGKSIAGPVVQMAGKGKWGTSDHVPSVFNRRSVEDLSLYFTRSEEEQKIIAPFVDSRVSLPEQIKEAGEHMRNLNLYVRVWEHGVEVGIRCHSTAYVDVMNLLAGAREQKEELFNLLSGLPSELLVDFGDEKKREVKELSTQEIELLDARVMDEPFMIRIYRNFEPGETIVSGPDFKGKVQRILVALAPLYRFWLWTKDNDRLRIASEMSRTKESVKEESKVLLKKGESVRITSGLFKGKRGKILEEERKGMVKVLIGKVVVRLPVENLR